ncbi:MAG: hypothetical protein RQ758_00500 [Methanomicrobiaceae archaeon]|nr:hypothetical protein [Methanomicrobiaceae archaeon]
MKRPVCSLCAKEAIGIEIFGCCSMTACGDHADPRLLALKPGESLNFGACFFQRYQEKEGGEE